MLVPNNTTVYNETNHTDNEMCILEDEINLPNIDVDDHVWTAVKTLLIFITIFTVLGNTLVLVATWKEKKLHKPNRYFIASRAVADLLIGIFLAPLWLYQYYKNEYESHSEITPSDDLCNFIVWMDTFVLTASIYTLTFISYERYLKISKPLLYRSRMTTTTSLKVIFIIWVFSTVFATYAATPYSGNVGILFGGEVCLFKLTKGFYTFVEVSLFFLPVTVMVIMYARIFLVAAKQGKIVRNADLGENSYHPQQQITFLQDLKVIRMLFVVVGVFLFCWGPFHIWILVVFHRNNNSLSNLYLLDTSGILVSTLPLFNSLCNPIIYACLDQKYRDAFKLLFQQVMRRTRRQRAPNAIELRLL